MSTSPSQRSASRELQLERLLSGLEHDLKNPVGNILGYLALLRDDPDERLSPTQAEFLTRIEQNCETILRLLRDFVGLVHDSRAAETDLPAEGKATR
jgi:signal transduction histidine kinase